MYLGYSDDRKLLGYPALKDTRCGIKLVFISDSVESKSKRIIVVICLEMLLIFGNVEPAGAKDNWFLPGAEGFLRYQGQVRVVVGTLIVDQRGEQADKILLGVVVEEIKTQVPEVMLAVVHQIQLQKLHLK